MATHSFPTYLLLLCALLLAGCGGSGGGSSGSGGGSGGGGSSPDWDIADWAGGPGNGTLVERDNPPYDNSSTPWLGITYDSVADEHTATANDGATSGPTALEWVEGAGWRGYWFDYFSGHQYVWHRITLTESGSTMTATIEHVQSPDNDPDTADPVGGNPKWVATFELPST